MTVPCDAGASRGDPITVAAGTSTWIAGNPLAGTAKVPRDWVAGAAAGRSTMVAGRDRRSEGSGHGQGAGVTYVGRARIPAVRTILPRPASQRSE